MDAYQRLVLGFLTDSHGGNVPYRHGRVRDQSLNDGEKADAILEFLGELGEAPEELRMLIHDETDLKRLTRWVKLAARSGSVEEFEEKM